jgi:hypothetical protein
MAEPTLADCASFTTIEKVFDWVGVTADSPSAKSLLELIGSAGTEHARSFSVVSEGYWDRMPVSWKIDGDPPSLIQAAQAGLVGRAIRIAFGSQKRMSEIELMAKYAANANLAAAAATNASAAAAAAAATDAPLLTSPVRTI